MAVETLASLLDKLKFGETALIEHNSLTTPVNLLAAIVSWAGEKNYPVLIDDVLDTLYIYAQHMELGGIDTEILNNVLVIKLGGVRNVGNVVGRVPLKEPLIQEREYAKVANSFFEQGKVVNPVLGFEKTLFLTDSKRDLLISINAVLSHLGDKRRIAFHFVNKDILEGPEFNPLPFLEELATTVFRVKRTEGKIRLAVVKSINNELTGKEIIL
ncbi:DUF257 family protein [Thermococcus alcaliphilus]|uniref:DUF257 family protein n=1 Tax=Thermococcus alcaliphilus TaxID=139207 RepID=UPI003EBD310A